jgi:uncharacterized phiE125 gp8 family phage protein
MYTYSLNYTSAAVAADIVTTADLKAHLRVDHSDEDTLIEALRDAAIEHVENYCNIRLGDVTAVLYVDRFPGTLEVPVGPVVSVDEINYNTTTATTATLSTSNYYVDLIRKPARISFLNPPSVADYTHNGVQVSITVGYAEANVPKAIVHALRLLVGHWYENRRQVINTTANEIPIGIHSLLNPYRIINAR